MVRMNLYYLFFGIFQQNLKSQKLTLNIVGQVFQQLYIHPKNEKTLLESFIRKFQILFYSEKKNDL